MTRDRKININKLLSEVGQVVGKVGKRLYWISCWEGETKLKISNTHEEILFFLNDKNI